MQAGTIQISLCQFLIKLSCRVTGVSELHFAAGYIRLKNLLEASTQHSSLVANSNYGMVNCHVSNMQCIDLPVIDTGNSSLMHFKCILYMTVNN